MSGVSTSASSFLIRGGAAPLRLLQQDSRSQTEEEESRDIYEFVAFLAWYMFLVLCCVIPTACAYRKKRLNEVRLRQAAALRRSGQDLGSGADEGLVFLRGSTIDGRPITIVASQGDGRRILAEQEERIKEERTKNIKESVAETSMIVTEIDLVKRNDEVDDTCTIEKDDDGKKTIPQRGEESEIVDEEYAVGDVAAYLDETEHEFAALTLPSTRQQQRVSGVGIDDDTTADALPVQNGSRTVPAACAICLCPYEDGDSVTWSPREECQHAFHTDCIVPWLAKKESALCPCCRQEFCDVVSGPEGLAAQITRRSLIGQSAEDIILDIGMRDISLQTGEEIQDNHTASANSTS
mmetsp:Transcript_9295/g.13229  ORF Transcript_9295/g.13229 Transcript_9295/m.13229 type:complete len:352 (-) Transcript_9295:484-1539(-)